MRLVSPALFLPALLPNSGYDALGCRNGRAGPYQVLAPSYYGSDNKKTRGSMNQTNTAPSGAENLSAPVTHETLEAAHDEIAILHGV